MQHFTSRLNVFILLITFTVSSCHEDLDTNSSDNDTDTETAETVTVEAETIEQALANNQVSHETDDDYALTTEDIVDISLHETSISSTSADAVTINSTTATIEAPGIYRITGRLNDGQLRVNTSDESTVKLIFNGVYIHNSTTSPVYIESANKVVVQLAAGTVNSLSDSENYAFEGDDDEPNATFFSKADLTFFGEGSLEIDANYNDGIGSKDGLLIKSGNLLINASDDGVRGKDYVIVREGTLTITAGGDGIKSDNEDETDRGYILIEGGIFNIRAAGDGLQAETDALIADGNFDITTGGGNTSSVSDDDSAKGIKAAVQLIVATGEFKLNTADDALHSNNNLIIQGGTLDITSGDDGIHADATVTITDGDVTIRKSYEGIKSADITLAGGTIRITSSDDGINGAGGNDGSGTGGFQTKSDYSVNILGGWIAVTSVGDGIDVNGSIVMSGGTVIVNGPTANNNGAIDYDQSFQITAGTLVAVGSSGMAQIPGAGSTQNSVLVRFNGNNSSGTLIHVEDSDGNEIITFAPAKSYQSLALSSPKLKTGTTCYVYTGGTSTGIATDGLFADGSYNAGSARGSFVVNSISTTVSE